jgi:polyhydroxybutyrate depolymerase
MTARRRRGSLIIVLAIVMLLCLCVLGAGTYWAVGPSACLGKRTLGPAQPGWSVRTLVSGGRERYYHLYVPPEYDPARPAPVVVSLHGFLSNPSSQAAISGWHQLADREGFIVVYPQGISFPQRWNAYGSGGAAAVDDVQFFRDLLDELSTVAAVDRSRVYVNGLSNGGGMAVRIGCEAADQVAAIGSVAGAVAGMQDCNPSRPLPVLAFHGTADPLVSYEGGEVARHGQRQGAERSQEPLTLVGAEDWVALWVERNGCDPTPEVIPPSGDVRGRRYVGCDQGVEVVLYTIDGGGHTWPGGLPMPVVGKTSADIDATEEMWRFFQGYHLDNSP